MFTMLKTPLVGLCSALTFVSFIVFQGNEPAVFISAASLGILMLVLNWSFEHLVVYAALLIMGIFIELLSVHVGLWSYPTTHPWGFPLWIPFMWSNGALFIVELKEVIDARLARRS